MAFAPWLAGGATESATEFRPADGRSTGPTRLVSASRRQSQVKKRAFIDTRLGDAAIVPIPTAATGLGPWTIVIIHDVVHASIRARCWADL